LAIPSEANRGYFSLPSFLAVCPLLCPCPVSRNKGAVFLWSLDGRHPGDGLKHTRREGLPLSPGSNRSLKDLAIGPVTASAPPPFLVRLSCLLRSASLCFALLRTWFLLLVVQKLGPLDAGLGLLEGEGHASDRAERDRARLQQERRGEERSGEERRAGGHPSKPAGGEVRGYTKPGSSAAVSYISPNLSRNGCTLLRNGCTPALPSYLSSLISASSDPADTS